MIKSFYKNNIGKENQINNSIRKLHASQLDFKMNKMIPISNEPSSIIQNISRHDSNKTNE